MGKENYRIISEIAEAPSLRQQWQAPHNRFKSPAELNVTAVL